MSNDLRGRAVATVLVNGSSACAIWRATAGKRNPLQTTTSSFDNCQRRAEALNKLEIGEADWDNRNCMREYNQVKGESSLHFAGIELYNRL